MGESSTRSIHTLLGLSANSRKTLPVEIFRECSNTLKSISTASFPTCVITIQTSLFTDFLISLVKRETELTSVKLPLVFIASLHTISTISLKQHLNSGDTSISMLPGQPDRLSAPYNTE